MAIDQQQLLYSDWLPASIQNIYNTRWIAQTFQAEISGLLTDIYLWLYKTGSPNALTIEIQGVDISGYPDGNILASTTIEAADITSNGAGAEAQAIFSTPATVISGTDYAIVIHQVGGDGSNSYDHYGKNTTNPYTNGVAQYSTNSGGSWIINTNNDLYFKTYVTRRVTIDSVLYGAVEDTITIDSVLNKITEDTFTADSFLAKIFTLDSNLWKVVEDNFTIDSLLARNIGDDFTIGSYLSYPNKSRHKVTFSWNTDAVSVDTTIDGTRLLTRKARIVRIFLYVENKGTSGTTKIDVNKNGTTIFTDQSKRPSIAFDGIVSITEVIPAIQNLDTNDRLTIDIDEAAIGASNLSVVVEVNTPTSYTHELRKVELLDSGILMSKTTSGFLTSTLQLKLVFDEPLDTTVEPTIVWNKNTMAANPSISAGGIFSSTYEKNDTYTTPAINVLDEDNYEGSADIVIKDAQNIFGQTINSFAFSIGLFDSTLIKFEDEYTNQATNALRLQSDTITKFRYSFDNATWSSWTDFISSIDIDITDAGIGGDAVEELKTLYVQVEDINGNSGTKTTTIYYKTTVGEVRSLKCQPAHRKNFYFLSWNLPTDANIIPIDKFEILVDGVKKAEITRIYPLYVDGLELTYATDDVTREITYSFTSGNIYDKDEAAQSVGAGDVVTDYCDAADRFDIVGINEDGELAVINGDEGLSATQIFWEKDRGLVGNSPAMPEIPENFLPLYIVHVKTYTEGYNTVIYISTVEDVYILDNRIDVVFETIELIRGASEQTITVRTTSESGAQSNTTLAFASNPLQGPTYQELRAWSETEAGGDRVYNGELIQESDLTSNTIYLQFIEEEE